jgi:hypothetical protein
MSRTNYTLERVLQLIRASYHEGMGDFSYQVYLQRLWQKLENIGDSGAIRPAPNDFHPGTPYKYNQAPQALQAVATEGYFWMVGSRFLTPKPTGDFLNLTRSEWYVWTERGIEWLKGAEPVPEEAASYMRFLKTRITPLDSVMEQYIVEALTAFDRGAYFAAAVMLGAASEKALYLLADSMVAAYKDPKKGSKMKSLMGDRKLLALFEAVRDSTRDAVKGKVLPYANSEGYDTHLMSLYEAIRVQRNDAVHPMNGTVSPDSVRLLLQSFPYALTVTENMRTWFASNPGMI